MSATATTVAVDSGSAIDGEAPQWPDDAAEAAFLSEQRANGEPLPAPKPAPAEPAEEPETETAALPSLQALVDKIPPETKETLDELFRARFVSVKRIPKAALKEQTANSR